MGRCRGLRPWIASSRRNDAWGSAPAGQRFAEGGVDGFLAGVVEADREHLADADVVVLREGSVSAKIPVWKSFNDSTAAIQLSRVGFGPARLNASTVTTPIGAPK